MRVLIITGDRRFGPGRERYELQKAAVEELGVMFWGKGSYFPRIPKGAWDVVTVQDPFFRGLFARHVARKLKARFNVQLHTDLRAQGLVRRVLARSVLKSADSVRVVSQTLKAQVEQIGIKAPITVLPVFTDLSRLVALAHAPHPRFKEVVLWIGRFEPEKDPLKMLAIFADIHGTVPEAGLVMLGAGSMESLLRERVARMGLSAWVEFPGWQQPAPYLAQADVVVSTSLYEGFGASMVEALAAGVPVVSPNVGVAREAGAIVVPRERLAEAAVQAMTSHMKGTLQLPVLSATQWAIAWTESLGTKL